MRTDKKHNPEFRGKCALCGDDSTAMWSGHDANLFLCHGCAVGDDGDYSHLGALVGDAIAERIASAPTGVLKEAIKQRAIKHLVTGVEHALMVAYLRDKKII